MSTPDRTTRGAFEDTRGSHAVVQWITIMVVAVGAAFVGVMLINVEASVAEMRSSVDEMRASFNEMESSVHEMRRDALRAEYESSILASNSDHEDQAQARRLPVPLSARELAYVGRAELIAKMARVKNAMNLEGLTEEQQDALDNEFQRLREHLMNMPR